MKSVLMFVILAIGAIVFADGATPVAAPPAASATLIAIIAMVVACINIVLSAAQQLFAALGKSAPGPLGPIANFFLTVSKFLGSNPDVPASKPPTPPAA